MNKIIYIALACSQLYSTAHASIIPKIYCSVFGNTDVSAAYRNEAHRALEAMGIQNPAAVPVKQMNGVGPAIARVNIGSFTACGIWLDEEYLNQCNKDAVTFHIYHEAAHYALQHHQKLILSSGALIAILIAIMTQIDHRYYNFGIGAAGISGYLLELPHFIREQEKEADLLAIKTLLNIGKRDTILAHLQSLRRLSPAETSYWWYTPQEQILYIENYLKRSGIIYA